VPVVVWSGADTSDLDPNQFACVLKKPIDPDALVEALERSIKSPRR
jgi:hypothetical protein